MTANLHRVFRRSAGHLATPAPAPHMPDMKGGGRRRDAPVCPSKDGAKAGGHGTATKAG
ncbi:hypothetical protein GCM10010178_53990 [Lentzea flava]|uniref:Uncharacterized protein n=1 Tax=Lentzea flava TaxID=103732 RepID=A0ABQ2UUR0_9PSEU|nr:hypothetical protein GCM10010178_53990 [Lentzea flava]